MTSTKAAASSLSPSATSLDNVAPVPEHGMSMSHRNLIIIVCSIVGLLITAAVLFITVSCRKRSNRSRLFHRAATPLSDAEFDLWRQPSKAQQVYRSSGTTVYKSTGTRYDGDVKIPAPACQIVRVDSKHADIPPRPRTPPQQTQFPSPTVTNSPATSTRPLLRSISTGTKVSRHKSSMSLQDRPPTPYSPSTPPAGWDSATLLSEGAPQSPRLKENRVHVHYPSVSEASDFDFGFNFIYGQPDSPRRESTRRESWVHHSRRFSSLGQGHPSLQGLALSDVEDLKRPDF